MLKIALQKSGRLYEGSIELLAECGLKVHRSKNALTGRSSGFPAELLFLRDDDIPGYVEDGVADMGIVGENIFAEKQTKATILQRLGFSKCRLSLAVPQEIDYTGASYFSGKKVATSYPHLTTSFFKDQGIEDVHIHQISGSVEIAPNIGLAEGISDLVSTGSTLAGNKLKEVDTILKSEAILIAHDKLSVEKKEAAEQLTFRIETALNAQNNKYILLNAPESALEEITNILPGMRSPTMMPLAEKGWYSLHSVISEHEFWKRIHKLKKAGAEGILIIPIEKMIR